MNYIRVGVIGNVLEMEYVNQTVNIAGPAGPGIVAVNEFGSDDQSNTSAGNLNAENVTGAANYQGGMVLGNGKELTVVNLMVASRCCCGTRSESC